MSAPDPPEPPDPRETAQASNSTNIGTAIANTALGNMNQVTPNGSLTYAQSGTHSWNDPYTGQTYDVPTWTATQTLSPEQQAIADQRNRASLNLATLGADQSARVGTLLSTPFNLDGAPAAANAANVALPQLRSQMGDTGTVPTVSGAPSLGSYGAAPGVNDLMGAYNNLPQAARSSGGGSMGSVLGVGGGSVDVSGAPKYQTASGQVNYNGPQIQNTFGSAGNIQTTFGDTAPVTSTLGPAGGQIQYDLQQGTPIDVNYGGDFSAERQRVEEALMSRMDPQLEQQRRALEARLADQGIRVGSEAYASAMDQISRERNDARMQAVLAGGQEHSRLTNLDRDRAALGLQAQGQEFQQILAGAGFHNDAVAQDFAQRLSTGQFQNAAQAQDFAQQMQRAGFANDAQAQLFGQLIQRAQFSNDAQAQGFGQAATQTQLGIQAAGVNNDARTAANNTLINQGQLGIQAGNLQLGQQRLAWDRQYGTAGLALEAQQNQYNQATGLQQQQYDQMMGLNEFNRTSQGQMFDQAQARMEAENAAAMLGYGNQVAQAGMQNAARSQYLNETYAARNQPINEITALLSGGQVTSPNFVNSNGATIPTTDVAGLIGDNYNQRYQNYQQEVANSNAMMGGVFGLAGRLIGLSDRREKTDIDRIGQTEDGQNVYEYAYKRDPSRTRQIGLMAQEVEKRNPDAVINAGGRKFVDYGKALPMGSIFGMKKAA